MQSAPAIPESLRLEAKLELQADKGDTSPPTFRMVAYTGKPMNIAGFFDPVIVDLEGVAFDGDKTPVIADHDTTKRIGHTTRQSVNTEGVLAEGIVSSSMGVAQGFVADAKAGFPFQTSIGADIVNADYVEAGRSVEVNGQSYDGPLLVARKSVIRELSVTVLGADSRTSAAIISANKTHDPERVSDMSTDLQQQRKATAAEELRVDRIKSAANRFADVQSVNIDGKDLDLFTAKAHAIEAGWDADRFELACMRAELPRVSAGTGYIPPKAPTGEVLQAVLLCRAGYESVGEKMLGAQLMEAANPYRSMSFPEIARMALVADGQHVPHSRDAMIRAAISTNSLTNALGGSMDKLLHISFQEAGATWRSFAAMRALSNFRQHTVISPQHRGQLEQLPNDGEIKHGNFEEDTSTLQIATYAKMVGVSRTNVVNDDLSIFDEISRVFAVQAARKLNDLVYEVIMANAGSFFDAGNNNVLTGAGSDLDVASLGDAVRLMRKQRDAEDNDLDIRPAVLVVPPELEVTAREILSSIEVNKTSDNSPTGNALRDIATLEVEPRLSNTTKFTNGSTTAWYLFSGPANAPVYVGTLDGRETPVIESFGLDADPTRLAFQWRVYGDWGAALGEHRAAVKADGA